MLIENNHEIGQLIAGQALIPLGYRVDIFESASQAIQQVDRLAPDVIITELNLHGLSGKDLMIALASRGINIPIIVIAEKDHEIDILQAVRLGAVDFLLHPIRETEVISVIEKAISNSRLQCQVENLARKLQSSISLLEQQKSDFSVALSFCGRVISTRGLQSIAEHVTKLAVRLTQADCAWLSVHNENLTKFKVQACQNIPEEMQPKFEPAYADELGSLVAASGEAVSLHGQALDRFTAFEGFGSVMVSPIMYDEKGPAIIVVAKNEAQPFTNYQHAMFELVAEFASSALENERRYRQIEHMMVMLQQANIHAAIESNLKYDLLRQSSLELRSPLKILMENVDFVLEKNGKSLDKEVSAMLSNILLQAEILMDIADSMINYRQAENIRLESVDLNEVVRSSSNRFRPIAQMGKITISLELPSQPSLVRAYASQISRVFEGLLSNALKYSPPNGEVTISLIEQDTDYILSIRDQGNGIDEQMASQIFDVKSSVFGLSPKRFGGIGISLPRIKEIISAYKGHIWVEPVQDGGTKIAFSIPRQPG